MVKKYRRVQFPLMIATAVVAIGGLVAVVALKHTTDPDYWLTGAAVLIPLVLAVGGKILRAVDSSSTEELDQQAGKLRAAVLQQWETEVALRTPVYPLPVPFSVAHKVSGLISVKQPDGTLVAEQRDVEIMDSWDAILRNPRRRPPKIAGTYNSITNVFGAKGLPSRMVVLGEPGSGKSILAQSLTVRLLGSAADGESETERSRVIPVLLPLATWDPVVKLNDWAAEQMARTYPWLSKQIQVRGGAERTLAGWLIDQRRVLMVLDGLDEIAAENRLAAFQQLREAATGEQAMIVTCRIDEYAQVVYDAGQPLPKTPVVRLQPLPLADVRTYLAKRDTGSRRRFRKLVGEIDAAPAGPLAEALSSPLALWLVTTVYQNAGTDPAELAAMESSNAILKHLLDGLVVAAYSVKIGDFDACTNPAVVTRARRQLSRLAQYLGTSTEAQNINWWQLPEEVPGWFIGGLIGSLVGTVLGTAVGLAATARFSAHMGIRLGIAFGIITGVLSGVTSARPQEHPRAVDLHFSWDYWRFVGCVTVGAAIGLTSGYADHRHGGLIAGLIAAAVVGPVCAAPCVKQFGWAPGITAGLTAAIALGLSSGLSEGNGHPIWSGLGAGLTFAISGWIFVGIFQPADDALVVNPRSLLDRDRVGCLAVAATAGVAFAVVYGIALGLLFGLVALIALTISVSVTVSMWAAFNVSRVWLACTGMVPMQIMAFLDEAYCRGVLRQVGGSYQFRHTELKEALLTPQSETAVPDGQRIRLEGANTRS